MKPDSTYGRGLVTFGDTFIITLNAVGYGADTTPPEPGDLADLIPLLNDVIYKSLQHGLMLRGAVAYGEWFRDEQTILGEAVAEAATWYEQADWLGLVVTPGLSLFVDHLGMRSAPDKLPKLVPYDVPLSRSRGGGKLRMLTLPWPQRYVQALKPRKTELWRARDAFLDNLRQHPVAPGSESKFVNTIAYWEHVVGWKT